MPNVTRTAAKCPTACNYCRLKKIKCNGGPLCSNCVIHNEKCIFPPPQRRNRSNLREENNLLHERIARMEAFLQNSNPNRHSIQQLEPTPPISITPVLRSSSLEESEEDFEIRIDRATVPRSEDTHLNQSNRNMEGSGPEIVHSPTPNEQLDFALLQTPANPGFTPLVVDVHNSTGCSSDCSGPITTGSQKCQDINSPEHPSPEHHGPISFLSICSKPGLSWVAEQTGASDFTEYARSLTSDISRSLKLQVNRSRERAAELDADTAWKYSNAYFEDSPEVAKGVVNRPAFEARLHAHFQRPQPSYEEDPPWYALRHTVYAWGCRLEFSRGNDAQSFTQAQAQAWRFFENALSVHTDLLYSQTGLLAVEALTAMSYFVEGLSSPALEYMLCSSAARLAQSKGMHLQPLDSWELEPDDILNRNWLFWTIYCHEKHIACRSGRPSAIDDDDISCHIPTTKPPGSCINVEYLTACIKHAQITSTISKKLATVKAYSQTPRELIQTVVEMDNLVESWRKNLPQYFQPTTRIRYSSIPEGLHIEHIIYLRYAYYGSLLAIHTIFTYPWTGAIIRTDNSTAFRDRVVLSTKAVVEASRNIILTTKHIDLDASSPVWMAFYYPFVGLVNLFVYILKFPGLQTAYSDVVLMDVVAGHFGRLEYLTSSNLAFPFIREITSLANMMVKRAKIQGSVEKCLPLPSPSFPLSEALMDEPMSSFGVGNSNDFSNVDLFGFHIDNWGALSQMTPTALDSLTMDIDMTVT